MMKSYSLGTLLRLIGLLHMLHIVFRNRELV